MRVLLGHTGQIVWASQAALMVKNPPTNAGDRRDWDLIPVSGRSPGGGHGNPLQNSYLENPSLVGSIQSMRSQRAGHDWSDLALTPPAWMTAWVHVSYIHYLMVM